MRCLELLGPVRVDQILEAPDDAQQPVADVVPRFRSRRTVGLLGYLVVEQRPIVRDFLAALFWPDASPAKGRANLSRELHNLAQILPDCWESNRQSIAFMPSANTTVDLYQLRQLEMQERWGEASELLGGEFLEGLYLEGNLEFENWLLGERERWRRCAEMVLRRVVEGCVRRGRYVDALRYAQRLLQQSPWDEETYRQIMRLLTWTGQRGAALRQFESCKALLKEELGVEPALETNTLYQRIQTGELDLPPQLPAFLTGERARRGYERPSFVGRSYELAQLATFLNDALAGQGRPVFISGGPGRGKTALLEAFIQQAMETHPHLLVVGGKCNAYSGVGDPYLPYRDAMAMLMGDVEGRWNAGAITRDHAQRLWEAIPLVVQALLADGSHLIDVLTPGAALLSRAMIVEQSDAQWLLRLRERVNRQKMDANDGEQSGLFQQVANVLHRVAVKRPLLLILDDIQWADAASISLLFHLGRYLADANSRLLIACAYRPEEVAMGRPSTSSERHLLAKVLTEFKRTFGDVWVDLDRVEKETERRFMDDLLNIERNQLDERFRSAMFDRTGGHPLFTLELLHAMQERGNLLKNADGAWIEGPTLDWKLLPARVEAAVEERVDRLDSELQKILTVASVEGELFTAQVVAEALNMPERSILHRLSQDLERQHRLVKEQEEVETDRRWMSRYRFGHALFQDYLYGRLGQGERRLLHGDVAVALETVYDGDWDGTAVQLAHHFYQAGNFGRAFHYATLAAERATHIYESREAIRHYTRAIQLAEKVAPDVVSLTNLYRGRGLAFERLGEFDQACSDHTVTLGLARAAGKRQTTWRASLDLGRLWTSRDYNQARDYFEAALELARRIGEPAFLADSLNWIGNWHLNTEHPLKAIEYHQEALEIVETLADRRELANTLDLLGIAHVLGGNLTASVQYYDQSITLLREMDDRPRLVCGLIARAVNVSLMALLTSAPANPAPDAVRDFEEAIRIAREINSAPDEAWACWAFGLLHTVHGRFDQAMSILQNGLRIASELGHREWMIGNRWSLGVLYDELFAPEEARQQLEAALALARELRSQIWINYIIGTLAGIYLKLGHIKAAQDCLQTALSSTTPMDALGKRYCWARRAELALKQDDPALTLDITERLIASAPGISSECVITFLWQLQAEALAAMGRQEDAGTLLLAAIENAEGTGEQFLLWRVHASWGKICRDMGRPAAAEEEFGAARSLIDALAATIADETLRENFYLGAGTVL
ncbi:MAG: tetratricopeptide repeat protein [Gammaproteobacteria bacterium]|nr:tetratricopeptide repeat protein [Gammaproteobacteria bacterium]